MRFSIIFFQDDEKLKTGSLVCLSNNDFDTIIFATITGRRDPLKLTGIKNDEKTGIGEFELDFEYDRPHIDPNDVFVMIEAPVFYQVFAIL